MSNTTGDLSKGPITSQNDQVQGPIRVRMLNQRHADHRKTCRGLREAQTQWEKTIAKDMQNRSKTIPRTLPKTLSENVPKRISRSSLWGHKSKHRNRQNRAQSPSDSPPGLIPELKRGLKAVKGTPGSSKESPGGSALARKAPKSSKIESKRVNKYSCLAYILAQHALADVFQKLQLAMKVTLGTLAELCACTTG